MWNPNALIFEPYNYCRQTIWQNSLQDDTSRQTTTEANFHRKNATTIKPQNPTRIEARQNLSKKVEKTHRKLFLFNNHCLCFESSS